MATSYAELSGKERPKIDSRSILERVLKAREIQAERLKNLKDVYANARIEDLSEAIHYRNLD